MNFKHWLETRDGALKENKLTRPVILLQSVAIVALVVGLVNKSTTVVLVPPTLEERSEIGASTASDQTKIAWGMYLAGLLGNITPSSSKALSELIKPHLSASLYTSTIEAIEKQADEIQAEQLSLSFAPKIARMDPKSKNVIVTGDLTIRGLRGQVRSELRTYVMGFKVRNYNVVLDYLDVQDGKYAEDAANAVADSN